MEYQPVESSQIAAIGYDDDGQVLGVKFKATAKSAASEYHYANVPPRIHRALMTAESVGKYFTLHIKQQPDLYPYTRVGEPLPPAPEPTMSALTKIDKMTPEEIFVPGTMDPILVAIKDEVDRQAAQFVDMTNKAHRDGRRAIAMKVTKSKTFIEQQRKSLVASEKKRLAAIDAEGRRIWDILEGTADEVRKPLTDWEQIDKDRKARHEADIAAIQEWAKVPFGADANYIRNTIGAVEAVDPANHEEYAELVAGHKANTLKTLQAALKVAEEVEAQKAENAKLQADAAERATQERAIAAARIAREQAERDAEAERQRLAAEAAAAEQRAQDAERRALEAVETERRRADAEKELERQATLKREQDAAHKTKIETAAIDAINELSGRDIGPDIIRWIAAGKVPNVTINY